MAIKVSNTTVIDNSRNLTNIGTIAATGDLTFSGTGAMKIPTGTDLQRPGTPSSGMLRFNTTSAALEIYNGTSWGSASGGGGGSASVSAATGLTYFLAARK